MERVDLNALAWRWGPPAEWAGRVSVLDQAAPPLRYLLSFLPFALANVVRYPDRAFMGSPPGGRAHLLVGMSTAKSAAKAVPAPEQIEIRADPIELTQLLKFAGLFDSGGEAKYAINHGEVTVNGAVEKAARKKIVHGDRIGCAGRTLVVKSLSK